LKTFGPNLLSFPKAASQPQFILSHEVGNLRIDFLGPLGGLGPILTDF